MGKNLLGAKDRRAVNERLYSINKHLHEAVPMVDIQGALQTAGLGIEESLLCGRNGHAMFPLFRDGKEIDNSLLSLFWYRYETTGRYEINAYLS